MKNYKPKYNYNNRNNYNKSNQNKSNYSSNPIKPKVGSLVTKLKILFTNIGDNCAGRGTCRVSAYDKPVYSNDTQSKSLDDLLNFEINESNVQQNNENNKNALNHREKIFSIEKKCIEKYLDNDYDLVILQEVCADILGSQKELFDSFTLDKIEYQKKYPYHAYLTPLNRENKYYLDTEYKFFTIFSNPKKILFLKNEMMPMYKNHLLYKENAGNAFPDIKFPLSESQISKFNTSTFNNIKQKLNVNSDTAFMNLSEQNKSDKLFYIPYEQLLRIKESIFYHAQPAMYSIVNTKDKLLVVNVHTNNIALVNDKREKDYEKFFRIKNNIGENEKLTQENMVKINKEYKKDYEKNLTDIKKYEDELIELFQQIDNFSDAKYKIIVGDFNMVRDPNILRNIVQDKYNSFGHNNLAMIVTKNIDFNCDFSVKIYDPCVMPEFSYTDYTIKPCTQHGVVEINLSLYEDNIDKKISDWNKCQYKPGIFPGMKMIETSGRWENKYIDPRMFSKMSISDLNIINNKYLTSMPFYDNQLWFLRNSVINNENKLLMTMIDKNVDDKIILSSLKQMITSIKKPYEKIEADSISKIIIDITKKLTNKTTNYQNLKTILVDDADILDYVYNDIYIMDQELPINKKNGAMTDKIIIYLLDIVDKMMKYISVYEINDIKTIIVPFLNKFTTNMMNEQDRKYVKFVSNNVKNKEELLKKEESLSNKFNDKLINEQNFDFIEKTSNKGGQRFGTDNSDFYKAKYLKYKHRYMNLKKSNLK